MFDPATCDGSVCARGYTVTGNGVACGTCDYNVIGATIRRSTLAGSDGGFCAATCVHGTSSGNSCTCDKGFRGAACDECLPQYTGANCSGCAPGYLLDGGGFCAMCDTAHGYCSSFLRHSNSHKKSNIT